MAFVRRAFPILANGHSPRIRTNRCEETCHSTKCNLPDQRKSKTMISTVLFAEARIRSSQRYLKFAPAGRLSDDLVVWTRTQEGDRWRHSQSCLAACWSLYTTVLTEW